MLTDKLFTGQRLIADLGIYHYGARFYSPYLNQFTQPDTIVPDPYNPQSLNRYSYVLNNPLRQETTTGPDGTFLFAELPVGRYSIALQTSEGKWMYLTQGFNIGNQNLLVESGKETNLHYIDISTEN